MRPETQAFAAVYQNDFKPEGLDFIESAPEADVEMSPAEENYDDEENDNGNTVSVQQLNARLREVARHGDQVYIYFIVFMHAAVDPFLQ